MFFSWSTSSLHVCYYANFSPILASAFFVVASIFSFIFRLTPPLLAGSQHLLWRLFPLWYKFTNPLAVLVDDLKFCKYNTALRFGAFAPSQGRGLLFRGLNTSNRVVFSCQIFDAPPRLIADLCIQDLYVRIFFTSPDVSFHTTMNLCWIESLLELTLCVWTFSFSYFYQEFLYVSGRLFFSIWFILLIFCIPATLDYICCSLSCQVLRRLRWN